MTTHFMARRIDQTSEVDPETIKTGDTCTTDDAGGAGTPPQIWTATVTADGINWEPQPWTLVRSKTAIRRSDQIVILDPSLV